MLGTDGTKALAPSRVQRLSARTSSGTPLRWGQVATSLLHVLAAKSHPTPEYAWEGVELALSSTNAIEHLSLPYDPASRRLFGVPIVATVGQAAGVGHVLAPMPSWSTPTSKQIRAVADRQKPCDGWTRRGHNLDTATASPAICRDAFSQVEGLSGALTSSM